MGLASAQLTFSAGGSFGQLEAMCEDGQPSSRSPTKAEKPQAKGEFSSCSARV